jgi:two-component system, cell cycle response regulator
MILPQYKVLLVEDMLMIAKVTEQMLKKALNTKYTVVHTARMSDTLEALKAEEFDVILLDLNLPDSRELDTLTRVVRVAPDVPIIVLTATNDDAVGLRAVQLGAQDFLFKGEFNYLTLERAIMYSIERHRLQRTIRQLAVIDELTGLYNRRGFNTLHPDLFQRVRQQGGRGFLCCFDLDRFKQINDVLGHQKGDDALKEFAGNLRTVFRKDVLLARLGGDEFVAMGFEQNFGQAEQSLQALAVLHSVRNATESPLFQLEASAGVAYFDGTYSSGMDELMSTADAALYRDKERRRRPRHAASAEHADTPSAEHAEVRP